jgi:hypothetical protein
MVKVIVTPNSGAAMCTGGTGTGCYVTDTFMVN